jgi:hypothetical protein
MGRRPELASRVGRGSALAAVALLSLTGPACKDDRFAPCRPAAVACLSTGAGETHEAMVSCVRDECSVATLRAIVSSELRLVAGGGALVSDPGVRAAAATLMADFRQDESNLDALEARLAIEETPCAESRAVTARLQALSELDAGAPDRAFVRSQVAALGEIKRVLYDDLIGCAANGSLKTSLRFARRRRDPDGGAERGVLPDLAVLEALAMGASP